MWTLNIFFHTQKDLRQGDALSLTIFNIVVDTLAILIARAKKNGHVGGLIFHLVELGGINFIICV
jgi:hypothetical protein